MKFSIKYFFSKCDQIRSFLRIWSDLLKKFCAVYNVPGMVRRMHVRNFSIYKTAVYTTCTQTYIYMQEKTCTQIFNLSSPAVKQKQTSRFVLKKRCSKNMQQIYSKKPYTSAYFQNTFS